MLRIFDVGVNLLGGIKSIHVDSLACDRVKRDESEGFRIDSRMIQDRSASCPLGFQCIYGCNDERGENGDRKEGSEIHGGRERMEITWTLVCR